MTLLTDNNTGSTMTWLTNNNASARVRISKVTGGTVATKASQRQRGALGVKIGIVEFLKKSCFWIGGLWIRGRGGL